MAPQRTARPELTQKDTARSDSATASSTQLVCRTCGALYPSRARFCPADGSALQSVQSAAPAAAAPADTTATDEDGMVGKNFAGKYKIERLLGEGGMAKVYLSTHLEIEKPVVIKVMHQSLPKKERDTGLKRFLQEIKVSAQLNHPNLVSVFDGGEIEGRPYLVMEYIKGQALRDYLNDVGSASTKESINIMSQALSGLQQAHERGIIHRDLKPENIMLREESDRPDWVKVVDFGIAHLKKSSAKLTATGIAIGTVDYMSPEYLGDKPIDQRSDIYALGIILFELLTGRCPFEADSAEAVMVKHLYTSPMPPSYFRKDLEPGCTLDQIVEKALQKDPAQRYQSAQEMRQALQKAAAEVKA